MESRKKQIITAAVKRFGHYGYSKTTMNELAEDLGITKANLYYYYADKMALFSDVIKLLFEEVYTQESEIIAKYNAGFMDTLMMIIDNRANHLKKYFALQINANETFDWSKGQSVQNMFCDFQDKEITLAASFFQKAIDNGELMLTNPREAARIFFEIMRSLGFFHKIRNMIALIPNQEQVEAILKEQKAAIIFIFEGKIIKK